MYWNNSQLIPDINNDLEFYQKRKEDFKITLDYAIAF